MCKSYFYTMTVILLMAAVPLLPGICGAGSVDLPKTGETVCHDEQSNLINCDNTGYDGEYQTGAVWPSPRFTDNGDGTVTDNLTGLMWLKDGNCFKGGYPVNTALELVDTINNESYSITCGSYTGTYADWRLPNIVELESLLNYGAENQADWLNSQGFEEIQWKYWSSTQNRNIKGDDASTLIYVLSIGNKGSIVLHPYDSQAGILFVRGTASNGVWQTGQTYGLSSYGGVMDGDIQAGTPWPSPRFTDNGDGTVTDKLTGLMWLKDADCLDGLATLDGAMGMVEKLNELQQFTPCDEYKGGYSDWRLPNRKELFSLVSYDKATNIALPAMHPFKNVADYESECSPPGDDPPDISTDPCYSNYWTSTTAWSNNQDPYANEVWTVNFLTGLVGRGGKGKFDGGYVWPVRGGGNSYELTAPSQYKLDVTLADANKGLVTSSPDGINCGYSTMSLTTAEDCQAFYPPGTKVILTAEAASGMGSAFVGWKGACSGKDQCTVTINQNTKITALFGTDDGSATDGKTEIPVVDVKANGSDDDITVKKNEKVSVTITVNPGKLAGSEAEYLLLLSKKAMDDNLLSSLSADNATGDLIWQSGAHSTMGSLCSIIEPEEVYHNESNMDLGEYTFFGGVDLNPNNIIDIDSLFYDTVTVTVVDDDPAP